MPLRGVYHGQEGGSAILSISPIHLVEVVAYINNSFVLLFTDVTNYRLNRNTDFYTSRMFILNFYPVP